MNLYSGHNHSGPSPTEKIQLKRPLGFALKPEAQLMRIKDLLTITDNFHIFELSEHIFE